MAVAVIKNNTRFYMNPMPPASNAFPLNAVNMVMSWMKMAIIVVAPQWTLVPFFYMVLVGRFLFYWAPKSPAFPERSRPTMRPNRPRTELKISITRILTNL